MEGWEPEEALINVQEMLLQFHAEEYKKKTADAGKRGPGRVAKKKKPEEGGCVGF